MAAETDLRERALEILRGCTTMTLATVGPRDLWAADVFFAPRSLQELIFISNPSTRHGQNIIAVPAVAATIHPDVGSDWRAIRGLQIAGTAGAVEDGELSAAKAAYFQKFPFAERLLEPSSEIESKAGGIAFFHLRVDSLYLVDNRLGFGVRHAIQLSEIP